MQLYRIMSTHRKNLQYINIKQNYFKNMHWIKLCKAYQLLFIFTLITSLNGKILDIVDKIKLL